MLVGVVAFNVLRVIPPEDNRALGVLLVGYFFQGNYISLRCFSSDPSVPGLGFFMTFFYLCIYVIR